MLFHATLTIRCLLCPQLGFESRFHVHLEMAAKRFTEASRFAGPRNYSLLEHNAGSRELRLPGRKTYANALDKTSRMLLLKHFHKAISVFCSSFMFRKIHDKNVYFCLSRTRKTTSKPRFEGEVEITIFPEKKKRQQQAHFNCMHIFDWKSNWQTSRSVAVKAELWAVISLFAFQ